MTSSSRDSIIERVRKLMALAGDNNNEHEVESALRFARKLMSEHGISEHEAAPDEAARQATVTVNEDEACWRAGYARWEQYLCSVADKVCDTSHYWRSSPVLKKMTPVFIGCGRDCAVASALWLQLIVTIRTMARVRFGNGWGVSHRCYADGFVSGLYHKSCDMYHKEQTSAAAGAIVLRKADAIKKYIADELDLKKRRSNNCKQAFDRDAYNRGVIDGKNTSLNTKVMT